MSRPRAVSGADAHKEPHSISLKADTSGHSLSRPSLSLQHPLPDSDARVSKLASLSYPSGTSDPQFILSPNLTLPPAFGSAYVGETFACSLSANNEALSGNSRVVTSIRMQADMQTPSQTIPLDLLPEDEEPGKSAGTSAAASVQKIIRFDLKEEGNHVLAVSVNYTETTMAPNKDAPNGFQASGGRVRTFRKLYQFVAQPCLSVRTKATELPPREIENRSLGPYGKTRLLRFALEAQLENVGDEIIVLGVPTLNSKPPFKSTSLNWDVYEQDGEQKKASPTLAPRDVIQLAFLVEQEEGQQEGLEVTQKDISRDGRTALGQLSIQWQGAMGEKGYLTTGNLMTKRRP
ncbi:DUF974 domain-containing protein [Nannizzia gypsea CBS 118893]|uniref:DUF974 domain-containing protein n=1 Tax=Arthroderma gypseum (strain ATCC MYA-4604 / CBS 118893) TaxID=535722 RepID=E5R3X2_ARTGP|nr:DUF974 domain-containing protein [Nannizzia gypsea CBS 118893]EFQ98818.1 DUF974 domain-containing protein [Nannizzia gypsea CBS 118893]